MGENWYSIQNDLDSSLMLYDLEVDSVDNNIIYVCGFVYPHRDSLCVEKTTDGGAHWFDISPPNLEYGMVHSLTISPYDHNTIYAATETNGVLKSVDGGLNWREMNEGLGGHKINCLVIDPIEDIFYIGTYYDGIYRSLDRGEHWQKISNNIKDANCREIAINPQDKNNVIVTTMSGVYRSDDGAATWQRLIYPKPYDDMAFDDLAFSMREPNLVFFICNSYWESFQPYVYRSTDCGISWQYFGEGLSELPFISDMDIAYLDANQTRLYLTSRGAYYSDNLGESWNLCLNGLPSSLYYLDLEVSQVSPNIIYVSEWFHLLYRTSDGGQSWHIITNPSNNNRVSEILSDPEDSNVVYAVIANEGVFKSDNMGDSWIEITNNIPLNPQFPYLSGLAINPYNNRNLFINSSNNGVFVSYDGGDNWEDYNEGLSTHYAWADIAFAPTDTNRVYLATSEHSVWSVDRNQTNIDDNPHSSAYLPRYCQTIPTPSIQLQLSNTRSRNRRM